MCCRSAATWATALLRAVADCCSCCSTAECCQPPLASRICETRETTSVVRVAPRAPLRRALGTVWPGPSRPFAKIRLQRVKEGALSAGYSRRCWLSVAAPARHGRPRCRPRCGPRCRPRCGPRCRPRCGPEDAPRFLLFRFAAPRHDRRVVRARLGAAKRDAAQHAAHHTLHTACHTQHGERRPVAETSETSETCETNEPLSGRVLPAQSCDPASRSRYPRPLRTRCGGPVRLVAAKGSADAA